MADGSDEGSSLPSAVKLSVVVAVPSGINGIGESCEAEAAIRHPEGT